MKTYTEKIFQFLIPLLFTFPLFKESISSGMVILILLNTILYYWAHKIKPTVSWSILMLTIPFWIVLFHSILTNSLLENETPIRHALFFLLIPICFSLIPISFFDTKKLNLYFTILKNTCLLIGLIYLSCFFLKHDVRDLFVVINNQNVSSFRDFVYDDIKIIQIHPTYLTSIIAFCTIYFFDSFLKERKYFELLYIFFLFILSFLLLAKLNIVFLVVILIGMLLFRSHLSLRKKTFLTLTVCGAIALLVLFTPGIKNRFTEVFASINKPPQGIEYNSTNIRKAIFDCSINLIQSDYLSGVGFSNLQDKLTACYEGHYLSHFYYENQYMTHNYFFYILISSGVLGFSFFIFYVFKIIKIAYQMKSFIFNVFLVNIFLMCLIEDFLYRHYGGLYFNLLLLVFIQHSKNKKTNQNF